MLKNSLLVLLLSSLSYSWAQVHPLTYQYLSEVLNYEDNLENSYPIYLGVPEGLDEAAPLHFYQPSDSELSRISTYYFDKKDSLITSTLHQWGKFDDLFLPSLPYNKKTIKLLRTSYTSLQQELVHIFGKQLQVYEDKIPNSKIRNEVIRWQIPILYDPVLNYRELNQRGKLYGLISLNYTNLAWEENFIDQIGFLQYYFFSNIKATDYRLAIILLSPDLQTGIDETHFQELSYILNNFNLELYSSREGLSGFEREYLFTYGLIDTSGLAKYTLTIAFNIKQEISFLQFSPIK